MVDPVGEHEWFRGTRMSDETTKIDEDDDYLIEGQYGFGWGPMLVERRCLLPEGRRVLAVTTDAGRSLNVYVSRTGRSVRCYLDGAELTASAI